jgi:integrase
VLPQEVESVLYPQSNAGSGQNLSGFSQTVINATSCRDNAILAQLPYPFDLVVKLLFGCGLRQFECLQLRVRDFNFDAGKLTIHGKGKKDRTVPIPDALLPELRAKIRKVSEIHDRDLAVGYDGVFLDDAVEKKYPNAPKEFLHQWFFPQKNLDVG